MTDFPVLSRCIFDRIYFSERGASPNAIVVANVKIPKPRMTDPAKIVRSQFIRSHISEFESILTPPAIVSPFSHTTALLQNAFEVLA
jgi:hypothetical protein